MTRYNPPEQEYLDRLGILLINPRTNKEDDEKYLDRLRKEFYTNLNTVKFYTNKDIELINQQLTNRKRFISETEECYKNRINHIELTQIGNTVLDWFESLKT